MKAMIIHPTSKEQWNLIEKLVIALNIPFEKQEEKSPYNPAFVKKIKHGQDEIKNGKGIKMSADEFRDLCK